MEVRRRLKGRVGRLRQLRSLWTRVNDAGPLLERHGLLEGDRSRGDKRLTDGDTVPLGPVELGATAYQYWQARAACEVTDGSPPGL